jgi:hypothetical protein
MIKKETYNNQHQHNRLTLLSRIAVPILFAGLVSATGGIIAVTTLLGEVSYQLFPSAEAAKKTYTCDGLTATIVGKERKNDVLEGTSGNDIIVGLGGNDQIFGNDGEDHACGGTGNDGFRGGYGDDFMDGGPGYDICVSGGQADLNVVNCEEHQQ